MSIASARPRATGLGRRKRRREATIDLDLPTRVRGRKSGRRSKRGMLGILVLLGVTAFALYKWWKHREEEHARLRRETPAPWAPRMDSPIDPTAAPSEPEAPAPDPVVDERPAPAPYFERTDFERTAELANGSETSAAPTREPLDAEQRTSEAFVASTPARPVTNEAAAPARATAASDESGLPATARPLGHAPVAHGEPSARRQFSAGVSLPERNVAPPSSRATLPRVGNSEPPSS